ncbi:hypothetical protein KPTA6363_022920 [Klebsiella pneumoniae]|nr:hypothetical protein KPTA6363_022920 [Klebsiella pneumoniae]
MRILKVIGLLLEYPDELLWENRDDALALIRADVPSLTPFVGELLTAPLLDRQAEWCEVFERGRATSLLLFEHVHAESRDRGQAMVDPFTISTLTCAAPSFWWAAGCATITGSIPGAPHPARCWISAGWCYGRTYFISAFSASSLAISLAC